jgi:hypothetical protein
MSLNAVKDILSDSEYLKTLEFQKRVDNLEMVAGRQYIFDYHDIFAFILFGITNLIYATVKYGGIALLILTIVYFIITFFIDGYNPFTARCGAKKLLNEVSKTIAI